MGLRQWTGASDTHISGHQTDPCEGAVRMFGPPGSGRGLAGRTTGGRRPGWDGRLDQVYR